MQKLYEDLNALNSIVQAMDNSGLPIAPSMAQKAKRSDVADEIEVVRSYVKASCKKLMAKMTKEEIDKVDILGLTKTFGEENKEEVFNVYKN